jgi:H/ACA ribonucleoprotein complex subunit 3
VKTEILKCNKCGKYSLKEACTCGSKAISPAPARFSPEDKYGAYRRKAKKEELVKRGLL